jgi:hypothetical protein
MKHGYIFASVLVISFLGMLAALASLDMPASDWTSLAPGIQYRKFSLPDPNQVYVARLERSNQAATIDTTIAQGSLAAGLETVSSMAGRADGALSYGTSP